MSGNSGATTGTDALIFGHESGPARHVCVSTMRRQIKAGDSINIDAAGMLLLTAVILLEPHRAGTKYTAIAIHGDEEGAKKHANMGFHDHWGKGLDQRVTLAKKMRG